MRVEWSGDAKEATEEYDCAVMMRGVFKVYH